MNRIVAYACLALSMSLVGSYVALSRPLVAALPVFLLAWLRFGMAGAALLPWLRKPADELPMTAQTRRLVFLESFLGNFLFSICMLMGVSMTSAVSAGVILAAIPAAVAVMSWMFLRERISAQTGIAVACAVVGIALVSLSKQELPAPVNRALATDLATKTAWMGHLLLLGAVLCEAAYAVIGKKLSGVLSPKRITALINLWGLALVTPFGLWAAWRFDFRAVTPSIWLLLLFYSMAASVWSVWLWMTGLKAISASRAGVFTVLLPLSAAATGVLFLGEKLDGAQLGAFVIALVGVVLATLPQRR
ncbi:MAG: DMT family transporter [Polaromonas sp.]